MLNEKLEILTENDIELIKKTRENIRKDFNYDTHPVSVGILDNDNNIYFGLSIKTPNGNNICGEPIAFSTAQNNSKTKKYKSIVAIKGKFQPEKIIPPCGICRELFNFHCPDIDVIIDIEKIGLRKIKAKYLLPYPYFSTRYPERFEKLKK